MENDYDEVASDDGILEVKLAVSIVQLTRFRFDYHCRYLNLSSWFDRE